MRSIPYKVGHLEDVDDVTTPPTDGQAIVWNDALQIYVPGTVASGGGGGGGGVGGGSLTLDHAQHTAGIFYPAAINTWTTVTGFTRTVVADENDVVEFSVGFMWTNPTSHQGEGRIVILDGAGAVIRVANDGVAVSSLYGSPGAGYTTAHALLPITVAASDLVAGEINVGLQIRVPGLTKGVYADANFAGATRLLNLSDLVDGDLVRVTDITDVTYTLVANDTGSVLRFTDSAAITVTLPVGLPIGTIVELLSWGAGGLTVQGDGTSTVQVAGAILQYEAVSCVVVDTDTWSVVGPVA